MISFDPETPRPRTTSYVCEDRFRSVFCFKITLAHVQPEVWRRIEVPDSYSFWDLHVAITDVFGWFDYHLHEFQIRHPKTGKNIRLSIPDPEDMGDIPLKPDYRRQLAGLFSKTNRHCTYLYDFGDGWQHEIEMESLTARAKDVEYPRCVDGKNACPPEDCGGVSGYDRLLKAISDPKHPEHDDLKRWLRRMKGPHFNQTHCDPAEVQFDNPFKRWRIAFMDEQPTSDMRPCGPFLEER